MKRIEKSATYSQTKTTGYLTSYLYTFVYLSFMNKRYNFVDKFNNKTYSYKLQKQKN